MLPPRVPVGITGMGAVSALGRGTGAIWAAIAAGRDGIRPIERFSTEGFSVHLGGMVADAGGAREGGDLCVDFAVEAAREAIAEAGAAEAAPGRIALVLGTSIGNHAEGLHGIAERVALAIDARGPCVTISTACSSSANALGLGRDLLDQGLADRVVAGGTDTLTPEIFAGFHALGLLSPAPCAPFSEPVGTTLGEGAGFLVLERAPRAPIAILAGYGLSGDAHHATSPDPTGAGVARAIRGALADAGVEPDAVDYLNAHGTGTAANDAAEWRAIETAFGARSKRLPVSSTKSFLGHAQGAAGVLELIATLLAMARGTIPPTLHHIRPRPRCPADPVAEGRPRSWPVRHAVCTSSAFGGANVAVVVTGGEPVPRAPRPRRDVFVTGAGAVGPHGTTLAELVRALAEGRRLGGRAPSFVLSEMVPTADTRGLDAASTLFTAAAARALADAGVAMRGAARERSGLFLGTTRVSIESAREFRASIEQRGLPRLSATAFTRMVLNAPAGACSRLLSLKGPTTTLSTGEGSGLAAVVYAAMSLATRDDADRLVAGGVDEVDASLLALGKSEGAACLVLATAPGVEGPRVRLAGWGLAGPGGDAAGQARAMAGIDDVSLAPAPRVTEILGVAEASDPVLACAAAVASLRRGDATSVLVADAGGSAASAVVLTTLAPREEPWNPS
jgi:3-oxoacyl-[acyl-carrier-protein] synthase II